MPLERSEKREHRATCSSDACRRCGSGPALPCPAPGSADLWRKLPEAGNEAEVASENEAGSTSEEDEDGVAKPVYGAGKRPPLEDSSYGQAAMVC